MADEQRGKIHLLWSAAYLRCHQRRGVKCSGYNGYGELGDNTTTERLTPVDAFGLSSGVTIITAGWEHTCAVTSAESPVLGI